MRNQGLRKALVDDGECIWITGASSGIGCALAAFLAFQGYRVAVSARRGEALEELAKDCADAEGAVFTYPLDVTDMEAVAEVRSRIVETAGPIGLAILNAGTHREVMARGFKAADVRALTDLNLLGCANCLEALLPEMIASRRGHIALVSSVAGYIGLPTSAAYGATKAGLINMAEALKPECDALGIKLQLVNPGFVRTPLTDRNPFPMPFLMEVEDAVRAMVAGLESARFEVVFPRRLAYILKVLRLLPYPLLFAVTRRLLPGEGRGAAGPAGD